MKFRFRHGPFQTQQEPVVEVGRVVDSILIENERAGQRTQLDQPMPIGGVPRQSRYFQAHHQTRFAKSDLTDEFLKPVSAGRLRAGLAQVTVEHVDTFQRPAQRHGAIAQGILGLRALGLFRYLPDSEVLKLCDAMKAAAEKERAPTSPQFGSK